jgi:DNA-binding CsgD family transcriptional regulator
MLSRAGSINGLQQLSTKNVGWSMPDNEPAGLVFEQRFDQWLQVAGLNRLQLAMLVDQAASDAKPGTEKADMASTVVLWLYGSPSGAALPPLLLDVINEYVDKVCLEASKAMGRAMLLRRATNALISSAAAVSAQPSGPEPRVRLTVRERQILCLIGNALPNRQIAVTLRISEKTVKNHITSLFAKLGVSDRTEALVVALRTGVLAAEELTSKRKSQRDHGPTDCRSQLGTTQPPSEDGTNVPWPRRSWPSHTGDRTHSACDRAAP